MFDIKFNLVTQKVDYNKVMDIASILRRNGFKVIDYRESDIRMDADDSKVMEVYIFSCQGSVFKYHKFKYERKFTEIMYEGNKTLI